MSEQLSLLEVSGDHERYNVFFALLPDEYAAREISRMAEAWRAEDGLMGRMRPTDHLHITLHHLADYAKEPVFIERTAKQIGEEVARSTGEFDVVLDRVMSFSKGNNPFVLTQDAGKNPGLMAFQSLLGAALVRNGITRVDRNFTPHITLLYDKKGVSQRKVDPVSWTVSELVLIKSHVGFTKYEFLGRWSLVRA